MRVAGAAIGQVVMERWQAGRATVVVGRVFIVLEQRRSARLAKAAEVLEDSAAADAVGFADYAIGNHALCELGGLIVADA
jgi:hypothetical protein